MFVCDEVSNIKYHSTHDTFWQNKNPKKTIGLASLIFVSPKNHNQSVIFVTTAAPRILSQITFNIATTTIWYCINKWQHQFIMFTSSRMLENFSWNHFHENFREIDFTKKQIQMITFKFKYWKLIGIILKNFHLNFEIELLKNSKKSFKLKISVKF